MLVVLVFLFAVLWLQIHNSGQLLSWPCSKWSESRSVMFDSLWPHGLYIPWNSPGQNTGVGSLSLLQGIIPTQGSNPGLPNCRQILYQLSHQGSPITKKEGKQWRVQVERQARMHQGVSLHRKTSLNLLKSIKNQTGRKATTSSLHMQLRCHDPVKY